MLNGKYKILYNALSALIPADRLITDDLRRLAYGTDASFYRLTPQLVIKAESEKEITAILGACGAMQLPVTFRAAGTSLSGQALSDSVLVMLGSGWKKFNISQNADCITLQPGIVGAHANLFLAPYGKKIGPDPASINSAMIGGIAANNASGMCCGTAQNSYKTLSGMRIIFHDGSLLDTNDDTSRSEFRSSHKTMLERIKTLADRVKADKDLAERITAKFKMKNTTGYSLNALIDFDDPIDILQHLMIGSEGTLAFMASITYKTVEEYSDKATALIIFPDIVSACRAVEVLKTLKADAVELMDRASLRSVEDKAGMPDYLKTLSETASALLVELRGENHQALESRITEATGALKNVPVIFPVEFTEDKAEYKKLGDIRKGLFPSIGAMRTTGHTVIIEDVAFPVESLAEATVALQNLFQKHGYYDAIIYGHALEGNLHFVFKQDFNSAHEVTRYKHFMDDIARLVVKKFNGSLKAEHGTGRNMAPFVEYEWGAEAFSLMKEIKNIFDPQGIINPGVIINPDPMAHIKNLKPLPAANPIVDKCIECGFCEVNCPSRDLTITPRQRITVWREISRLKSSGSDPARLAGLIEQFDYYGDQTCATDGLCATSCPVEINTGNLVKELRAVNSSPSANGIAGMLSGNMSGVTKTMKLMLNAVDAAHALLGTGIMESVSGFLHKVSGGNVPLWNKYMPKGADAIATGTVNETNPLKAVYFPSCINRTMGTARISGHKQSLTTVTASLLKKAGYEIIYPEDLGNLCCGMAFASKGFKKQGDANASGLISALLKASQNGQYPILFDMSPCLYRIKEYMQTHNAQENAQLKIYEPVEFILEFLSDKLTFTKQHTSVAVHSTCSSIKMGLTDKLVQLAQMCADNVVVPQDIGCCGWAGDRGFTYPELNASALHRLKEQIPEECTHGYSTSRTCEIGLSMHSGINYDSIVLLADQCTEPKL